MSALSKRLSVQPGTGQNPLNLDFRFLILFCGCSSCAKGMGVGRFGLLPEMAALFLGEVTTHPSREFFVKVFQAVVCKGEDSVLLRE